MAIIPADEKVFMVDKRTNTIYGGSQALQDMQQWYTMQDVSDSVQPYKVFTALLTQSGGDGQISINGGNLTVGVTYFIDDPAGGDWTNVGAPNNNTGTYFIATGTTPNAWDDGTLFYNTGAPVATVLENTIGNVWFSYSDQGEYGINTNGLLTISKTSIITGLTNSAIVFTDINYNDGNSIYLTTTNFSYESGNNLLLSTPIEIRVYN
jgi:hypothetical protein